VRNGISRHETWRIAAFARSASSIADAVETDGKHSPKRRSIVAFLGTVSPPEGVNNAKSVIDQSIL
jgi:hypothetical protein